MTYIRPHNSIIAGFGLKQLLPPGSPHFSPHNPVRFDANVASAVTPGVVQVGDNLDITPDGVLSAPDPIPGDTGPTGAQGLPGDPGPRGDPGVTGPTGPAGAAVSATTISVTGSTGPRGPEGQPGVPGPTGPASQTIAISATGPTGAQGIDGQAGPTGPRGEVVQQLVLTSVTGPTGPLAADSAVLSGSWTPALIPSRGGSVYLDPTDCHYTQVGDLVTLFFDITVQKIIGGEGTSAITLSGLPMASASRAGAAGIVTLAYWSGLTTSPSQISGTVPRNDQVAQLWCRSMDVPDYKPLTQGHLASKSRLIGTVTYLT